MVGRPTGRRKRNRGEHEVSSQKIRDHTILIKEESLAELGAITHETTIYIYIV